MAVALLDHPAEVVAERTQGSVVVADVGTVVARMVADP